MALEQQWELRAPTDSSFGTTAIAAAAAALRCCWAARSKEPKGRGAAGEQTEVAMDASAWGNFSGGLLEFSTRARLPFTFLKNCKAHQTRKTEKTQCDSWLLTEKTQRDSWLMSGAATENKVPFYVPSLEKWCITTLPLLDMQPDDVVFLMPGMGGLVCLTKYRYTLRGSCITDVFVWNPLTNLCRQLPRKCSSETKLERMGIAGMYLNNSTMEYKVMTVDVFHLDRHAHPASIVMEIYDSGTDAWKICDSRVLHPKHRTELGSKREVENMNICCKSTLYHICSQYSYTIGELCFGILAFELETEVWREIKVQHIKGIGRHSFVELYNKVYMVGNIIRDNSVRVWELLEHANGTGQWIERERLPREFMELLDERHKTVSWRCTGSGDTLFFKFIDCLHLVGPGLEYNISRRSWSQVPTCEIGNKNSKLYSWNHGLALSPGWMLP